MARRDTDKDDATASTARLTQLPTRLAQALFTRQLRLKRGEKGIKLVLEGAQTAPAVTPPPVSSVDQAARVMRSELTALLDGAPGSRQVLRYLAGIESGLKHKDSGGLFLFDAPLERIEPALAQLDGLLSEPVGAGLSLLRSRLMDAIQGRRAIQREHQLRQPLSSFFVDHKLEVEEVRASDFEQASVAWHAQVPQPSATPNAAPNATPNARSGARSDAAPSATAGAAPGADAKPELSLE